MRLLKAFHSWARLDGIEDTWRFEAALKRSIAENPGVSQEYLDGLTKPEEIAPMPEGDRHLAAACGYLGIMMIIALAAVIIALILDSV